MATTIGNTLDLRPSGYLEFTTPGPDGLPPMFGPNRPLESDDRAREAWRLKFTPRKPKIDITPAPSRPPSICSDSVESEAALRTAVQFFPPSAFLNAQSTKGFHLDSPVVNWDKAPKWPRADRETDLWDKMDSSFWYALKQPVHPAAPKSISRFQRWWRGPQYDASEALGKMMVNAVDELLPEKDMIEVTAELACTDNAARRPKGTRTPLHQLIGFAAGLAAEVKLKIGPVVPNTTANRGVAKNLIANLLKEKNTRKDDALRVLQLAEQMVFLVDAVDVVVKQAGESMALCDRHEDYTASRRPIWSDPRTWTVFETPWNRRRTPPGVRQT